MPIKAKQVVQFILKELPNNTIIKYIKKSKKVSKYRNEESRIFRATKPLQLQHSNIYTQLKKTKETIREFDRATVYEEIEELINSLKPKYQKGDPLLKVEDIELITFSSDGSYTKENSEFQVDQGIIYLIIIWDANREYCLARIDKYQSIFEKNPQWESKVKMVCFSINQKIESLTEVVKQKNWKSIQHYRIQIVWQKMNTLLHYTQWEATPFVMLINKKGRIDYLGYNPKENFQDRINKLITDKEDEEIKLAQKQQEQMDILEPQEQLTKEEYKGLKQQWKDLQKALKRAQFEGDISIVFEKVTILKQDGIKGIYQNPKFILEYSLERKEEPKINQFLENYWNQVPQHLRYIKSTRFKYQINQKKIDIKKVFQEEFQTLGVNITYIPYCCTRLKYKSKKNEMNIHKTEKFYVNVDNLTIEQYQKGYWTSEDALLYTQTNCDNQQQDQLKQIINDLSNFISLRVGQQFQTIENYKKLGQEEFTKIEHIPDEYIQVFNIEVIKTLTERWGDAVRFVNLSNEQIEEYQEIMYQFNKYSDYMDFYFPKHKKQPDQILYQAQHFKNFLVDKVGTIRFIGNNSKLYQLIEKLINNQDIEELLSDEVKTVDIITQDTVNRVQDFLLSTEALQQLNYIDQKKILKLDLNFQQIRVDGLLKFQVPSLNLLCRDSQLEIINQILNSIFEFIPENYWNINKTVSKTISVPYPGSICSLCNKDILNEAQQYYSPFKKVHVCVECAEFEDQTKKGSDRYKSTDNLVFINGPLTDLSVLESIDDHKIGKNLQLKEGEEGSQRHPMMCNGCSQGTEGPRYIAVSARPGKYRGGGYVDYCQNCFVELKNKESEKAQAIVQKDAGDGMVKDSLLVRILFSHGNYRDF